MSGKNYPALAQFLGAYFHQDFLLDYGNPDAAITAFLAGEPKESVRAACNELDQVIRLVEGMDNPDKFLWQTLGCYYSPKADGLAVADWLRQLRKQLSE
jgi:hypothetical protein